MSTSGVFAQRGNCVHYIASSGTASATIQARSFAGRAPGYDFTFTNFGPATAFVGYGDTAADALANAVVPRAGDSTGVNCFVLPPGQVTAEAVNNAFFAAVTLGGTADLYITPGKGPINASGGIGTDSSGGVSGVTETRITGQQFGVINERLFDILVELRTMTEILRSGLNTLDDPARLRADAALV